MGLVAQVLNPAQLPDGTYDSRNWRAKIIVEVTWQLQSLPSFGDLVVNAWAGFDFSTLLNLPSGLTAAYSLTGDVPTGVSIHSSTGVLSQTGTTPASGTVRVVATVSGYAFATPPIALNFVAAAAEVGDTEAPSYSMGLSATTVEVGGVQKVDLTIMRANDTAADDETPGGLGTYTITRDASPLASGTDVAVPDPGESIRLVGENLGDGISGSVTRTGSDYLINARGGSTFFGETGEHGEHGYALVNRDGFDFAVAIESMTGDVVAGSTAGLRIATSLDPAAPRILAYTNSFGARVRRSSSGGTAGALIAPISAITIPCMFRCKYLGGNEWQTYYSPGTDKPTAWVPMAQVTLAAGSQVYVSPFALAAGNGTTDEIAVQFRNFSGSSLPAITFRDENPTPNSNEVYTVTFEDADGNASAASGALTVAVPASTLDEEAPTAPVFSITGGQNAVGIDVSTGSTDAGSGFAGYIVRYGTVTANTVWASSDTDPINLSNFSITGLTDSTSYVVSLQPIDNANNPGTVTLASNGSVTTLPASEVDTRRPPAPTITVETVSGDNTKLRVKITPGPNPDEIAVTGFYVYSGTTDAASGIESPLIPISAGITEYLVNVTPGQNYWNRSRSYNPDGIPTTSAASPIVGPVATQTSSPTGNLSYEILFSDPSLSGTKFAVNGVGGYTGPAVSPRPVYSTARSRSGDGAAFHKVKQDDEVIPANGNPVGNYRSEIIVDGSAVFFEVATEYWIGFSLFLDPVMNEDDPESITIHQLHQAPWNSSISFASNPPVHIGRTDDGRDLSVYGMIDPNTAPTGPQDNKDKRTYRLTTPWPTGQWMDVIANIRPAYNDAQNGFIRYWFIPAGVGVNFQSSPLATPAARSTTFVNGVWAVHDTGKNINNSTLPDVGTGFFYQMKFGIYIPGWRLRVAQASSRMLYSSDLRISRTSEGGSWQTVAPRGTSK